MTRSAMGDERRWAARYQFLEDLWQGRDRIVYDRELEAAVDGRGEGAFAGLVDTLLTRGSAASEGRVWMPRSGERRAAPVARAGATPLALADAPQLASTGAWQVALIHLGRGGAALDPQLSELLAALVGPGRNGERSVVLTVDCGERAGDDDRAYEQLADLSEELFGDARIYGLSTPGMAAFYDFGPVLASEEGAEEVAVDIEVDNSLGSEAPRFHQFIAVVGQRLPADGLTFVELPTPEASREAIAKPGAQVRPGTVGEPTAAAQPDASAIATSVQTPELAEAGVSLDSLRAQLAESRRRAEVQAIERQELLEKLEQAEERLASLDEVAADAPRLDAALAREQALTWELDRLKGQLAGLEARPVDALEAEVAALRARLAQAQQRAAELDSGEGEPVTLLLEDAEELSVAQGREWLRARGRLDQLLRRLERGAELSALALHRELTALRELL